jgi:hypothetical protein
LSFLILYIYATRFWFFNFSFGGQYQLVLLSLATFSIAFFRDPGSAVFGHYGDRSGENYVGNCFIDDGYFNSFHWFYLVMSIGIAVFIINAMSLWPGVGLGGEWGGAVLLAIENAPPNKRAYGMFPQLGSQLVCYFLVELS